MLTFSLLTELAQLEACGVCHLVNVQGFPCRRALSLCCAQQEVSVQSVHTCSSSKGSVLFWRVTCAICSFAVNTAHHANPSLINYSHSLLKTNYKRSPWAYKKSYCWFAPNVHWHVSCINITNLHSEIPGPTKISGSHRMWLLFFSFFPPISCLSSMFNYLLFLAY